MILDKRLKQSAVSALLTLAIASTAPFSVGMAQKKDNEEIRFLTPTAEIKHLLLANGLDADWLRVARLEAGAQLNSHVALQAKNYFGMHFPRQRGSKATFRHYNYAGYSSMTKCIEDIRLWSEKGPRLPGENFDHWLRRRGWNPYSEYYRRLAGVRLS